MVPQYIDEMGLMNIIISTMSRFRTPEGTAYEADVQVSDMSGTNNKIMAIAIDATEVSVTDEFLLPTPYRMEEEGD